ncbi:hypothetical protein IJS77_03230 [bacterium]|nr:hypothetical protein [bacterium]
MNEVLNFFQDFISSELSSQKPVGLSGFKHPIKQRGIKKPHKKEEVKISDLLRRK